MFKLSIPTKKQILQGIELAVVTFVASFSWSWVHSSDPFSKAALVGAGTAGISAVYSIIKSLIIQG